MAGPTPPGGDPAADPSMEDILASIRRILNEDEAPGGKPAEAAEPHVGGGPAAMAGPPGEANAGGSGGDDGVLLLDEAMLVPAAPPPTAPSPPATSMAVLGLPAEQRVELPLLAPEASAAAAGSVQTLMKTLSTERSTAVHRGGPTVEDLVREEIRPMLKDWLDSHLPPLVERLVRQEIERVTGRAAQ